MKKFGLLSLLFCIFNVLSVFASIFDSSAGEFSADGKKLVFQNVENIATIWDLETYKEINSINLGEISVEQIKFLPNGKQIVVFDNFNDKISFFDILSGKLINSLEFETQFSVNKSLFSSDGQTLVLASESSSNSEIKVVWFDLNSLKTIAEKTLKGDRFIGNSTKNLFGIYEKETQKFQLFSAKDGSEIGSFPIQIEKFDDAQMIPLSKGFAAEFSGNGNKFIVANKIVVKPKDDSSFAVGEFFNEVQVYSIPDGKLLGKIRLEAKQLPNYPAFEGSPEISVNQDGTLLNLWDTAGSDYKNRFIFASNIVDLNTLKSLKSFTSEETPEETVSLSPNGKTFFKYDENEKLSVFSNDTQKQIATLYPNVSGAEKIAVSSDNEKYASVSTSGLIKIWNSQGVLLKKINSETSSAKFISFSPNGQTLVTAHFEKNIDTKGEGEKLVRFKVWNVNSGTLIREFSNKHYEAKFPQYFLIFNNLGDRIIADCSENSRILELCSWNINTGEFFVRAFPSERNTVTMIWFDDKQPFNFNKLAARQSFSQDKENETFLWNYADSSLVGRHENLLDFNANIKGKSGLVLMLFEGYSGDEYKFFRINPNDELKLTDSDAQTYITSLDQKFGATITFKPTENQEKESSNNFNENKKTEIRQAKPNQIKNVIEIKDFESETDDKKLESHTDEVTDFVFTTNGRGISTSLDKTIRVWDVKTGKELFQLK